MKPSEIENASMAIIARELGVWKGAAEQLPVVMRVIHTTADFDFAENLVFSPDAVGKGRRALASGSVVVTDTNMAAAGINKTAAAKHGVSVVCRMAQPEIASAALARGLTRAVVSVEEAVKVTPGAIYAIGNAPTALIRLCELIDAGAAAPALVIAVPVGFVNVVESKEMLIRRDVPYIAAMGRKGGSAVASAIVNALFYGIS